MGRRAVAALGALVLLAAGVAGCGEEEGVADGAKVTAYVESPLCDMTASVDVVETESGEGVGVSYVCLPAARGPELGQGVGGGRQIDLAQAGANARQATQDSTTVVYIEPDDPGVGRFTHPILEAAGVGWIAAETRGEALRRLSDAVFAADTDELRADVRAALGQG